MENRFKHFLLQAKHIALDPQQKARMRNALLSYMTPQWQKPFAGFVPFLRFRLVPVGLTLFLCVTLGGGLSLAAEGSLPGETLYPIKLHVNENIRSVLSFSSETKANWAVEQTQKRLAEVEKLTAQGDLNKGVTPQATKKLAAHAEIASGLALKLESEGKPEAAAEIYSNLEATLQTHEEILERLGEQKLEVKEKVTDFVEEVQIHAKTASQARIETESKVRAQAEQEVKAAAEDKLNAAETQLAKAQALIEKPYLSKVKVVAEAKSRLKAAQQAIDEGKAKMETDAFGEAFAAFQKASRLAKEAKLLLTTSQLLELDIGVERETE